MSLGELFIELGVVGDVKPLEKALKTMKQTTAEMERQYNAAKRLAKYLDDLKKAQTEAEKTDIKKRFEIAVRKDNEWKLANKIDKTKELASNIAGIVKGVGLFVGALTGAAVALNNFTNSLVESNQAMLDLTRTTDIAQSTFQKWGGIGKILGVENADQQLASLNDRLFELMLTGEGARGFQLGGINPIGQDANGVMEQLRARVSGMDDTTASYLLRQMGIDPKMLHLLRMERQEFEELGATIRKYQFNEKQRRDIQDMNIQIQITAQKLQYLKDKAVLALMPAWTRFMHSLARVVEGFEKAVQYATEFINKSPALQNALKGVALALGTILAVTQPLWAALSALYLIFDDIAVYMQGGDSVIGMLLNYTDTFIEDFKNIFKGFADGNPLAPFIKGLTDLSNLKIKPPPIIESLIAVSAAITVISQQMANLKKKWDTDGTLTGGAARIGFSGDLSSMFITPAMQQNIQNNGGNTTNNTDNKLTMNNYIQTTQPVADIQQQLNYARFAMV